MRSLQTIIIYDDNINKKALLLNFKKLKIVKNIHCYFKEYISVYFRIIYILLI